MKPIRERRLQLIDHFTHRDVEWQLSRLLAAHGAKILSSEGIETLAKMLVAEMRYGRKIARENAVRRRAESSVSVESGASGASRFGAAAKARSKP
jgi:hypothetical protein